MNGIPTHNIITNISRSVNHIKCKLPESTVVISELVAANFRLVKEANEELRKLANTIYVRYSGHHLMRDKFVDGRHVNRRGTSQLISDIYATLGATNGGQGRW